MAFDPYDQNTRMNALLAKYGIASDKEASPIPKMDETEAESLLSKIGQNTLSGLGYAAQTLNKGGRAARGLLSGDISALANLIPFSDTLGITNPEHEVTGRNLLENAGLIDKSGAGTWDFTGSGSGFGDVAGLAADIVTDPLSYFLGPTGALTKGGVKAATEGIVPRLAKNVATSGYKVGFDSAADLAAQALSEGKLAPTAASRILADQGGAFGFKFPGFDPLVLGKSPEVASLLEKYIEPTTDLISQLPPVRAVGRLFNAANQNAASALGQSIARTVGEKELAEAGQRVAERVAPVIRAVQNEGLQFGAPARAVRIGGESVLTQDELNTLRNLPASGQGAGDIIRQYPGLEGIFPRTIDAQGNFVREVPKDIDPAGIQQLLKGIELGEAQIPLQAKTLDDLRKAGISVADVKDLIDHLPRNLSDELKNVPGIEFASPQLRNAINETGMRKRNPNFTGYKLGTVGIDDLVRDPRIAGASRLLQNPNDIAEVIAKEYLSPAAHDVGEILPGPGTKAEQDVLGTIGLSGTPSKPLGEVSEAIRDMYDKAKSISKFLGTIPDDVVKAGKGMFSESAVTDLARYSNHAERAIARANTQAEIAARAAYSGSPGAGDRTIEDIVRTELKSQNIKMSQGIGGIDGFIENMGERFARDNGLTYVGTATPKTGEIDYKTIKNLVIPKEVWPDLVRMKEIMKAPDELKGIVGLLDGMMKVFKNGVYTIWPPGLGRNFIGANFYRLLDGALEPGPQLSVMQRLAKPIYDAASMLGGKDIDMSLIRNQAGLPLTKEAFANEVMGTRILEESMQHDIGKVKDPNFFRTMFAPGLGSDVKPKTLKEALPEATKFFTEPLQSKGIIAPQIERGQRWLDAMRELHHANESMVRLSHYISLRRQGISPEMSALRVKKWHFDYNPENFTNFERNFIKRVIPFYTFAKENAKLTINEILNNPGGKFATIVKESERTTHPPEEGFVPEYIREQEGIPLGPEVDGTRRFLTGLGLPTSEFLSRFRFTPEGLPNIQRTVEGGLSQLRPEIKAPLESIANRSFFFGRPLDTIQPLTGLDWLDQLAYNSPISRAITSGRRIMDPRKDALSLLPDLFSGVKVTDVNTDPAKKDVDKAVEEMLKANPLVKTYSREYVPKNEAVNLDETTKHLLSLYNAREEIKKKKAMEFLAAQGKL